MVTSISSNLVGLIPRPELIQLRIKVKINTHALHRFLAEEHGRQQLKTAGPKTNCNRPQASAHIITGAASAPAHLKGFCRLSENTTGQPRDWIPMNYSASDLETVSDPQNTSKT